MTNCDSTNGRFAADVYLGTADVVECGEVVDRGLVMRRLLDDRRLALLLEGTDVDEHLRAVARVIAAVHAAAPPLTETQPLATADGLASFWRSSFEEMAPLIDGVIDGEEFDEVQQLAFGYLDQRAGLFERRQRDGHVRDGHGDLVAADIYMLADGPRILDCLAFDADSRICDVVGDIGFMAMDVERIAGPGAAVTLLDHYGELTGERHPLTLIEHWIVYRAHVRAKVALLRHDQGASGAAAEAASYHTMTVEHLRRGRSRIMLIGGGPGTGKSTLARAVAARTGWAIVDSDIVRKDLHGVDHDDHAVDEHPGLYESSTSALSYQEIVRRGCPGRRRRADDPRLDLATPRRLRPGSFGRRATRCGIDRSRVPDRPGHRQGADPPTNSRRPVRRHARPRRSMATRTRRMGRGHLCRRHDRIRRTRRPNTHRIGSHQDVSPTDICQCRHHTDDRRDQATNGTSIRAWYDGGNTDRPPSTTNAVRGDGDRRR